MKLPALNGLLHGAMLVGAIALMALPVVVCGAIAWVISDDQRGWTIEGKLAGAAIGVAVGGVISAVLVGVFGSSVAQWWANRKKPKPPSERGPIEKAREKGKFRRGPYP
jgi:formate hydrogenlyase subunit 3/multisubunit Na+/H+ antiporter MnhD subunit